MVANLTPEQKAANDELEKAIQVWLYTFLADTSPHAMLDDWMVITSVEDPTEPDTTGYFRASAGGGMPHHRAIGLLTRHLDDYRIE